MPPLVSPAWLAGHLDDPNTVILDATLPPVGVMPSVDTHGRYLAQHIPGTIFFDIEALSDPATSLPHMLPSSDFFAASMSAMGIGNTMTIVVYEQEGVFSAPRARWMLRTFGAPNVLLLDGGLNAWLEAGLSTQSGEVRRAPATFLSKFKASDVKDFADIQDLIAERAQILDARSAARFNGTAPEPRSGLSSGHMPGATSVPFTELVEDGHLKSPEALRALFASKSVALDRPLTTTCGSGVTAAVVALGLELAGARDVTLYDGSWAEYAQHPSAVIETS
ncbi:MAG TPA: 3-mercaptopyruvate sulfurtransferase [Acidobacteriaceae bacterium]